MNSADVAQWLHFCYTETELCYTETLTTGGVAQRETGERGARRERERREGARGRTDRCLGRG
eukprot:1195811-Prorocentrum_minimum.AAC.2